MRKVLAAAFVSLDGVMQAPGGPEEDPTGGFEMGGWTATFWDDVMDQAMGESFGQPFDLLLGRKTYDIFAGYWPNHGDSWPGINDVTKYVLSNTLEKTDWNNSVILRDVNAIQKLRDSEGAPIQVHGSGELVRLLLRHGLVDELWLKIYPLTLGRGKKLFDDGAQPAAFALTESLATPSGIILANYKRAGEVRTGVAGE